MISSPLLENSHLICSRMIDFIIFVYQSSKFHLGLRFKPQKIIFLL